MNKYWLTVHWPIYEDEPANPPWKNKLFMAERYRAKANLVKPGDNILIYETAEAPRKLSGGKWIAIRRRGKQGVVAQVILKEPLQCGDTPADKYEDGRTIRWNYTAKTQVIKEALCSLEHLRQIMGWSDKYYVRITGGLMQLDKNKFDRICNKMR